MDESDSATSNTLAQTAMVSADRNGWIDNGTFSASLSELRIT